MANIVRHHDLWVTEDGTFGNGDILLFDTQHWSDDDWNEFDEDEAGDPYALAVEITERIKRERSLVVIEQLQDGSMDLTFESAEEQ